MAEKNDDLLSPDSLIIKGGFKEEDILRIHVLWVGYAMCKVFERGYKPENIMTLYTSVNALESFLTDKLNKNMFRPEKEIIEGNGIRLIDVVKAAQHESKGYAMYERIVVKYRRLIMLAKKAHTETGAVDQTWGE